MEMNNFLIMLMGSIVEVFTDLSVCAGIRKAIERVNANATVA